MTASAWSPNAKTVPQTNANGLLKEETHFPAAIQRIFIFETFAYTVGTGSLLVFKNGAILARNEDYIEASENSVVLTESANLGDKLTFVAFVGITGQATVDAQLRSELNAYSGSSIVGYDNTKSVKAQLDILANAVINAADPKFAGGVKGGQDITTALQAAHDYAAANFTSATVHLPPAVNNTKYKLNGTLIWDTNKVRLVGHGEIDCSNRVAGVDAIVITQSEGDVNRRFALNSAHPIEGIILKGPGKNVNCRGLVLDDSVNNAVCGVSFVRGGLWNWGTCLYLGNGAFFTSVVDSDIGSPDNLNGGVGTCVSHPANLANAGERNVFTRCRFSYGLMLDQGNGDASTFFENCSFNYSFTRMMSIYGGTVYINGGHIESNTDADYWFHVTNSNSALTINGANLLVRANKINYEIFYCDASVTHGSITLNLGAYGNINQYPLALVGGTGRVDMGKLNMYQNGSHPLIGKGCNRLAYGDFEDEKYTAECTLVGPTPPERSNADFHSGAWSLAIQGINSQTNGITFSSPCTPGQSGAASFWAKLTGINNGGHLYSYLTYRDKGGNIIGAANVITDVQANTGWVKYIYGFPAPAPVGTVSAELHIEIFGVVAGVPIAYIDEIIFNVY